MPRKLLNTRHKKIHKRKRNQLLVDYKVGQNLTYMLEYECNLEYIKPIIHTIINKKNLQNSPVHTNLALRVKAIRFRRDFHGGKSKALMHNH